jgi:hypothetical protein
MVLTFKNEMAIIESTSFLLQNINIVEGDDAYGPLPMGLNKSLHYLLKVFEGKAKDENSSLFYLRGLDNRPLICYNSDKD